MTKLFRISLCFLCLAMIGTINFAPIFAQVSEEPAIKEASGEIISVDVAAKTVVAKISNDDTGKNYEQVTLSIDDDTTISSQDSTLDVSDLKPGNKVIVVYETIADGTNKTNSIMVK